MTATELKQARIALKCNPTEMAEILRTPKRTYVGWEANEGRIPGVVELAMELLQQRDQWATAKARAVVSEMIEQGVMP
jgi:DNA-binding transcriptional regulator YiaG